MSSTHKQQVLRHLQTRGSLTTLTAFGRYGICRLSERIRELEQDGYLIIRLPVRRHGKRYMSYYLDGRARKAA